MAESTLLRSPFSGHVPGEHPTANGSIGVRLGARTLSGVTLIGTWPDGAAALEHALGAALGAAPLRIGQTQSVAAGLLLRIGPEEFMLVSPSGSDGSPALRAAIAADVGSVTDLGHARCRIDIDGERCRDALGKLFALDLRTSAFLPGQVRLTGHHHVACMLHRRGLDRFDLYVPSSYAADQLSTLIDAAREYGVQLLAQSMQPAAAGPT